MDENLLNFLFQPTSSCVVIGDPKDVKTADSYRTFEITLCTSKFNSLLTFGFVRSHISSHVNPHDISIVVSSYVGTTQLTIQTNNKDCNLNISRFTMVLFYPHLLHVYQDILLNNININNNNTNESQIAEIKQDSDDNSDTITGDMYTYNNKLTNINNNTNCNKQSKSDHLKGVIQH